MQIKHFVNGEWVEVRQNKLAEAFDHAAAHGSEFVKDLYKIATNNQGHVTQATPVTKTDLTNYGLLDTNAVAPVYSGDTTYSTGEFCIYQGKLYKALQDVDHEEFNPSKWEESNLLTATIGGGTVITGEADWNAQQGNLGYIKNKPEIPEGLPLVSAEDNGKTLVVDDGEWTIGSGGGGGAAVISATDIPYLAQALQTELGDVTTTGASTYANAPFYYHKRIESANIVADVGTLISFLNENDGKGIMVLLNGEYAPVNYSKDSGYVGVGVRGAITSLGIAYNFDVALGKYPETGDTTGAFIRIWALVTTNLVNGNQK